MGTLRPPTVRRSPPVPTCWILALAIVLWGTPLAAEESEPPADGMAQMIAALTPGTQHAYLATLSGTWKATFLVYSDPSQPPLQGTGILERTMILGGRVLQEEIKAQIMGLPYDALGHVGYDNVSGKYWASSFDTLSTGLTALEGSIDETTGKATFLGKTPIPQAQGLVPMRLELSNEGGKQITESYITLPGAGEVLMVKTVYERQ